MKIGKPVVIMGRRLKYKCPVCGSDDISAFTVIKGTKYDSATFICNRCKYDWSVRLVDVDFYDNIKYDPNKTVIIQDIDIDMDSFYHDIFVNILIDAYRYTKFMDQLDEIKCEYADTLDLGPELCKEFNAIVEALNKIAKYEPHAIVKRLMKSFSRTYGHDQSKIVAEAANIPPNTTPEVIDLALFGFKKRKFASASEVKRLYKKKKEREMKEIEDQIAKLRVNVQVSDRDVGDEEV